MEFAAQLEETENLKQSPPLDDLIPPGEFRNLRAPGLTERLVPIISRPEPINVTDLLSGLQLGKPQQCKNLGIIPLIVPGDQEVVPSPIELGLLRRVTPSFTESERSRTGRDFTQPAWDKIQKSPARTGGDLRTSALADVHRSKAGELNEYLEAFRYIPGQNGLLAIINGEVVGGDIIPHKPTYQKFHDSLVKSYALSAISRVFVSSESRTFLPISSTPLPPIVLDPAPEPAVVRSVNDALLDDVLAYFQNERVRSSPSSDWPAHCEAFLSQCPHGEDPARRVFLRHQIQHLRATDAGHSPSAPGPVAVWLRSSTDQQRSALTEAWRYATWNDLFQVPTLHLEETRAWRNDPVLTRQVLLHHLKACTPHTWYKLDNVVTAIKEAHPDFLRPTGTYLADFKSWDAVEGALIRYMITGPLTWLGLADLGADMSGELPTAFRLNQADAAFLDLTKPMPEPVLQGHKSEMGEMLLSEGRARSFLQRTEACRERRCELVGYGTVHQFEGEAVFGSVLTYNQKVVHVSFFNSKERQLTLA